MRDIGTSQKSVFILNQHSFAGWRLPGVADRKPRGVENYIVPMVARAIEISEHLQKRGAGLSVDDLRDLTGYSPSTIYRILRTLASFGYVVRELRGEYKWSAGTSR